jgi:peptidoglycan L-alanyl-D-glutamate endopeptidase CwlK
MKNENRLIGIDIRVVACIESLAEKVMKEMGRELIIVSAYRSLEQQTKLYEQGRSAPGKIVTRAMAGQSPHNFNCAIDTWIMSEDGSSIDWNNQEYKEIARTHAAAVSDKIVWGGNFNSLVDLPHWELKSWRMVRAMVEKIIPNSE